MGLHRLSVGNRLVAGFLIVVLGMVAVTALGVIRVGQVSDRLTVINELNSVKQRYAINFRGSVHDRAISLRDVVLAWTPPRSRATSRTSRSWPATTPRPRRRWTSSSPTTPRSSPDEVDAYAAIQGIEGETLPLVDEVIALRAAGDNAAAAQLLMTDVAPLFSDWLAVDQRADRPRGGQEPGRGRRGPRDRRRLPARDGALLRLAAASPSPSRWRIARSITGPMADAVTVFAAVSEGDLTQRLDTASKDGLGELGSYANLALARMGEAMAGVSRSAAELAATSNRVGQASDRIAGNAQESSAQADVVSAAAAEVSRSVQTVAAGSEEMGASIREIAQSASEAAQVANRAVAAAETTNVTVSRLGDSSREIGDVVKVISSIAEQTNLLALNATIEAAAPARSARASPSSPTRSRSSRRRPPGRPRTSPAAWRRSRPTPPAPSGRSRRSRASSGGSTTTRPPSPRRWRSRRRRRRRWTATCRRRPRGRTTSPRPSRGWPRPPCRRPSRSAESQQAAVELADVSSRLQQLTSQFRVSSRPVPHRRARPDRRAGPSVRRDIRTSVGSGAVWGRNRAPTADRGGQPRGRRRQPAAGRPGHRPRRHDPLAAQPGGLVTALEPFVAGRGGAWVGWSGSAGRPRSRSSPAGCR